MTLPLIVAYTTVYEPWEEGADERAIRHARRTVYEYDRGWDPPMIDWAIEIMCDPLFVSEPSSWPITRVNLNHMWFMGWDYEHPYDGTLEQTTVHLEHFPAALRWAIVLGLGHRIKPIRDALEAGKRYG